MSVLSPCISACDTMIGGDSSVCDPTGIGRTFCDPVCAAAQSCDLPIFNSVLTTTQDTLSFQTCEQACAINYSTEPNACSPPVCMYACMSYDVCNANCPAGDCACATAWSQTEAASSSTQWWHLTEYFFWIFLTICMTMVLASWLKCSNVESVGGATNKS